MRVPRTKSEKPSLDGTLGETLMEIARTYNVSHSTISLAN
jgi:hypothetical protein